MVTYTDASLVEAEIRADQSFSTSTIPTLAQLNVWIGEESAQIDRDAGMSFASTAYTDTIDYDGDTDILLLQHAPLISITNVLYSSSAIGTTSYALSDTKVENTDYVVYDKTGEIVILTNNWKPKEGRKRIQINYTAGYATTPEVIQKLATKMVAKRVLDSLMTSNTNNGDVGGSVSVGSISIVDPADFGIGNYKQLSTDIDMLKADTSKGFGVYRYGMYYTG